MDNPEHQTGARILVIDDEEMVRSALREILEREGHQVIEAENGQVGLQHYRNTSVDLVITDLYMPIKEGLPMIIELKKEDPAIQIIAMSGGGKVGSADVLTLMKDYGVSHTLKKPFGVKEVIDAVDKVLDR